MTFHQGCLEDKREEGEDVVIHLGSPMARKVEYKYIYKIKRVGRVLGRNFLSMGRTGLTDYYLIRNIKCSCCPVMRSARMSIFVLHDVF